MSQQCYQIATKPSLETFPLASLETEKQGAHPEPVEQVLTLQLSEGKTVRIGSKLEPDVKRDIDVDQMALAFMDGFDRAQLRKRASTGHNS